MGGAEEREAGAGLELTTSAASIARDESAERHRSIVETAVDAIITIDEHGVVESINPAGERMFGWRADELIGRNVSVLMSEPDRSAHDGFLERYVVTGRPRIIGVGRTVTGLRRDGTTFPIHIAVGEMWVGGQRMFTGILADVSDLHRAENRLLDERDHALRLLDAMQDGLTVLSPGGVMTEVNREFCAMTGFSREELLGSTPPYPYWDADPAALERGFRRIREEGSAEWDLVFHRKDGGRFPVILKGSMLPDARGEVVGYLATVKDVTERRRDDERLRRRTAIIRTVLDTSPDGMLVVDRAGRMLVANAAARRLLEDLGIAHRLRGTVEDQIDAVAELTTDPEGYRATLLGLLEHRETVGRMEWELAGSGRIIHEYTAPVRIASEPDGILGRLFVLREVTAERQMERARDDFVALVSHELRTPLTSVTGYLDLLLDDEEPLAPDHRHFAEVAARNARRLGRLVDDLVVVARSDAGRLGMLRGRVDLGEVAAASAAAAREAIGPDGPELEERVQPAWVLGDRERLAQVCDGLISNARKFTPPDGRIGVRVSVAGDRAELVVDDTGVGIPAAERERVFERFYRGAAAIRAQAQGAGLGLAIARLILEAHGGRIEIGSKEGPGTLIRVELPLADSPEEAGV